MKNYLLLTLALLFTASLHAQKNEIVLTGSTKTTTKATPHQIIDSLHRMFPHAQSIEAYKTPESGVVSGWQVTKDDRIETRGEVARYTISFKNNDFQYYALFNADGSLVMSKYQENGATLPAGAKESVIKYVGINYKGYQVESKTYFKEINYENHHKEYYEVVAINKANPNIKKKITLDQAGKVVRVKDM
jgi:hypothetical protein